MKALAIAALAIAAAAGAPAFASDFTFDVPLTIENAPAAASVTISCQVSIVAPGGANAAAATNVVGRTDKIVPLVGGAFRGNVVVEVNAAGSNPATAAKSYNCYISQLTGKPVNGGSWAASLNNMQQIYEKATNKKVDHMTLEATGALP